MDSQKPLFLKFGPYELKVFSPQQSFKQPISISPAQQWLLDNLWRFRTNFGPQIGASEYSYFSYILKALAGHFNHLNALIAQAQQKSLPSSSTLDLRPRSVSELEKQVQMLKLNLKEKEKQKEVSSALTEQDILEIRKFLDEKQEEREKKWWCFPAQLNEVKLKIFEHVLAKISDLFIKNNRLASRP